MRCLLIALLCSLAVACSGGSDSTSDSAGADSVSSEVVADGSTIDTILPFEDMYQAVLQHLLTSVEIEDGNWCDDFGDSSFYGQSFLAWNGSESQDSLQLAHALDTFRYTYGVATQFNENPASFLSGSDDLMMGMFGIMEVYKRYDEITPIWPRDSVDGFQGVSREEIAQTVAVSVDALNDVLAGMGDYAPNLDVYSIKTYGNTTVTALFALLNVEYVRVFAPEDADEHIAQAKHIISVIDEKAWDDELVAYRYRPEVKDKLYLYPNITMMLLFGRLAAATDDPEYVVKAQMIHAGIQPLKDESQGSYHSPYSMEVMGAKTDDYKTLSSQLYTSLALMSIYEGTGNKDWLDQAEELLQFIQTYLYKDGQALHHWMDGEIAKPEHLEYYCSGCNFQLLYAIKYLWSLKGPVSPRR